jgi:NAD(P)-dependent dehydrogenase (short-subunit alcohol dehydrogenase family)
MRFEGEVAVVTGASQGIGRAVAAHLAAEGAEVVAAARNGKALERLAEDAAAAAGAGGSVHPVAADVSIAADVRSVFEAAAGLGGCSILVAAAGVLVKAGVEDTTDEAWEHTLAVNLTGSFRCSRAAFEQMRARGAGRIVLISSLSGVYGTEKFPGLLAYNASKHGVVGLMEGLAVEGRDHGIGAISLSPGAVDTEMLRAANPDLNAGLQPEDVARLVADLLDGPIHAMSGANVPLFSNR